MSKGFVEKIRAASQLQQDNAAKELKRKLNRDCKRSSELDGLIIKARMKDISELQKHIGTYGKTREIYAQYRKLTDRK